MYRFGTKTAARTGQAGPDLALRGLGLPARVHRGRITTGKWFLKIPAKWFFLRCSLAPSLCSRCIRATRTNQGEGGWS
jgi:hypothetical protein